MSILEDFLSVTNQAISTKDVNKLGLIIMVVEDTATEDIFNDGPLDSYYDIQDKIGEEAAFEELSRYWFARGLKVRTSINTISDFIDFWNGGCGSDVKYVWNSTQKEWSDHLRIKFYEGHAEFILNHIDFYKNLETQLLNFITGNVGEEFVADAMKKIQP